ncbi:hypothetical protein AX16_010152 [Volvariella volvacea WC 439]|nr:hypothetical protein AX16_010152 [Volvariella volvacea WC 439]
MDSESSLSTQSQSSASTSSANSPRPPTPPLSTSNNAPSGSSHPTTAEQPSIQPQTERQSPEVIDVDLLDDDELGLFTSGLTHANRAAPAASNRPGQGGSRGESPEVISISDSDDELDSPSPDHHDAGFRIRDHVPHRDNRRNRLISPPPPRPQSTIVPPVPALPGPLPIFRTPNFNRRPASFSQHITHPGPSHAPLHTPPDGPIRPIDEPFAFEASLQGRPPPRRVGNEVETMTVPLPRPAGSSSSAAAGPSSAPPSHHVPSMGFGGALLTNMRRLPPREREQGSRDDYNFLSRARNSTQDALARLYNAAMAPGTMRVWGLETFIFGDRDSPDSGVIGIRPLNFEGGMANAPFVPNGIGGWRRKEDVQYQSTYTHPDPADAGYTYDFMPASPTSSSPKWKGKAKVQPEVIVIEDSDEEGGIDSPGAGPSKPRDAAASKAESAEPSSPPKVTNVLVCASCSDSLVLNPGASGDPAEENAKRIWGLRCGHLIDGKCLNKLARVVELPLLNGDAAAVAGVDGSGAEPGAETGKAKGKGRAKGKGKGKMVMVSVDIPVASAPVVRSGTSASASASASASTDGGEGGTSAKKIKRRKGRPPRVEAEWTWECPVESCKRAHTSLKLGGVWEQDKDKGAIQLFV